MYTSHFYYLFILSLYFTLLQILLTKGSAGRNKIHTNWLLLHAKSNKKVLLTKGNKNDRNQQINNNNNLITLE